MPPTLAHRDPEPTAIVRTLVGYNSAVYTYTIENDPEMQNLPIIASVMEIQLRSGRTLQFSALDVQFIVP